MKVATLGAWRSLLCAVALMTLQSLAHADEFSVTSGLSAHWFNAERSGEGLVLEILSEEAALLYWFTYDEDGNQRWLIDVGEIDGAGIVFPELTVTRGGRFGPDFDSDEVEYEVVGEAVLQFSDCDHAEFTYSAFNQSETIAMQRLSQTMAAGCQPINGVPGQPIRAYAGQSGSWYDPAHTGEGYTLQWMSRDEAVLIWFSYDPDGNQYWMIGTGTYEDGRIEFPVLQSTQGGRFGGGFDPDDVEYIDWGSLTFAIDCDGGTARYESELSTFGNGQLELNRLTLLGKPPCPWQQPKITDLYDFELTRVPVHFQGTPSRLNARDMADDGTVVAWGNDSTIWRWSPGEEQMTKLSHDTPMQDFLLITPDASLIYGTPFAPVDADGEQYGPMTWRPQHGWQTISGLTFDISMLHNLSQDGSVLVGAARDWGQPLLYPWIWTPEEGQQPLPVAADELIYSTSVSNDAEIVVGGATRVEPLRQEAVRWEGGYLEFLIDSFGAPLGNANACDDDCSVVVGASQVDSHPDHPHFRQAWYQTADGTIGYLGSLPDALEDHPGTPYAPLDITSSGTMVVGTYFVSVPGLPAGSRGFIWTQATGLVSIRSIFQELDIGDDNWSTMTARRISSNGELILIEGQRLSGHPISRAYIMHLIRKAQ